MHQLDPRLHAFRPDLADARLKGRVGAATFVDGRPARIIAPSVPMRRHPAPDAPIDTEALMGETVTVFEATVEGWAWVQLATDGYVGYVSSDALAAPGAAPTHRVAALRTFLYPGPDLKLPPLCAVSIGARLVVTGEVERSGITYALLADGSAAFAGHLAPLDTFEPDFVAVAERFVGTPYLWGGRTSLGLDCSALVQVSLAVAGIAAPRDSDQQAAALGTALELPVAPDALHRGDLVFWRGHAAIARGQGSLVHANAHHMAVAIEPADIAFARIAASGSAVVAVRRVTKP